MSWRGSPGRARLGGDCAWREPWIPRRFGSSRSGSLAVSATGGHRRWAVFGCGERWRWVFGGDGSSAGGGLRRRGVFGGGGRLRRRGRTSGAESRRPVDTGAWDSYLVRFESDLRETRHPSAFRQRPAMQPAFRTSPGRTRRRRAHQAIRAEQSVLCPNCGSAKRAHAACTSCGYVRPGLTIKTASNG